MDSSTQTPREKLTKKQQEVYDFIVSSMNCLLYTSDAADEL